MTFNLVENLKQLRNGKSITQVQLAEHLKVSNSNVAYWETNGHQPDLETMKKIANFFYVSVDCLLANE